MSSNRPEYMKQYRIDHQEEGRAFQRAYYQCHKEEIRSYKRTYNAEYRDAHGDELRAEQAKQYAEFTEWLQILRTVKGCEDCGVHEGLLEHHHLDPSTKRYCVSHMHLSSLDALEDELEKCVVLCRPCHHMRHVTMRALAA